MSASLNFTSAAGFQAYVQDYAQDLLYKFFFGFPTASLVTPHEGVKGKKLLTEITTEDLVRRYSSTFAPLSNAMAFVPRNLEVVNAKVDLKIIPKDFEGSYLGMARQKGQDSYDLPFEGRILERVLSKVAQEMELAFWRGEAAAVPAGTDKLSALFDGVQAVIAAEIDATNLTPVTTGTLSNTNIVGKVEQCHSTLGSAYLNTTVDIFLSPKDKIKFIQDYRERYGKFVAAADGSISLETGMANIHVLPGVPENCILVTPKENLHYGYDGPMDHTFINFETEDRAIKMWMDFNMGFNFGIVDDELLVVNDQWGGGSSN
jgi:hypothetical protein